MTDATDAAARAEWFARAHAANAPPQAPELPESWAAALDELRKAFCGGAWAACVVLAFSLAEAAERHRPSEDAEFEWLRERRNRIAHLGHDYPTTVELEADARGAIRAALRLAYAALWR